MKVKAVIPKYMTKEEIAILDYYDNLGKFRWLFYICVVFGCVAFLFIVVVSANKINYNVWFCGNGIIVEDPCLTFK